MPYMQKPLLADEDLKAVIAFLRSDDELVAPSDVEPPPTRYTLLGRILLRWISSPLPYPTQIVLKPDSEDDLAQGRYLVANLGCYECHSASITGINRMKPEKSKGYMSGGNKLRDAAGHPIYSRNLTFDGTGLKGWSKEDFIKAVKMGVSKNNSVLRYPMPSYAELTDEEAGAIFTYLKSLPPTHHEVKRIVQDQVRGGGPADGLDEQLAPGKQDYEKYASVRLSMGHKRSGVYDFARCRSRARISGVTW